MRQLSRALGLFASARRGPGHGPLDAMGAVSRILCARVSRPRIWSAESARDRACSLPRGRLATREGNVGTVGARRRSTGNPRTEVRKRCPTQAHVQLFCWLVSLSAAAASAFALTGPRRRAAQAAARPAQAPARAGRCPARRARVPARVAQPRARRAPAAPRARQAMRSPANGSSTRVRAPAGSPSRAPMASA